MKTTFWKGTSGIWVGSSWDRSMWVAFVFVSYSAPLHPGISILPRTLCPHRTYSWSSPNTDPDSFLKDWWLRTCPVFLFSPSYRLPVPIKMSVFIYLKKKKKPPTNFQWLFEYKIFIPWLQITVGSITTQQVLLVQIHFRFIQAGTQTWKTQASFEGKKSWMKKWVGKYCHFKPAQIQCHRFRVI